jgi:hypothetical protein
MGEAIRAAQDKWQRASALRSFELRERDVALRVLRRAPKRLRIKKRQSARAPVKVFIQVSSQMVPLVPFPSRAWKVPGVGARDGSSEDKRGRTPF